MRFKCDIKPIKITSDPVAIPLDTLNPEMIEIDCDMSPIFDQVSNTKPVPYRPTAPSDEYIDTKRIHALKPEIEESKDNGTIFQPSGDIIDAHFTNDGRLVVLTEPRTLYIIDTEHTNNITCYELCNTASFSYITTKQESQLTSTADGAIWVINHCIYYMFKGNTIAVYSPGISALRNSLIISQWAENYIIGIPYFAGHTFTFRYAVVDSKTQTVTAIKEGHIAGKIIKWNNKLLVQNIHAYETRNYHGASLFLSLHEWKGGAKFRRTHRISYTRDISSIIVTDVTAIIMEGSRGGFTIFNQDLQDIFRLNGNDWILSASVHLGRIFTLMMVPETQRRFESTKVTGHRRNIILPKPDFTHIIGPLDVTDKEAKIIPAKLVTSKPQPTKLLSSFGFLFLVTKFGIYTAGATWSRHRNKLMPDYVKNSVTTLYTLRSIGALNVPVEILDIILTYAFTF